MWFFTFFFTKIMKGTICWNFHKLRLQEMLWNINEGSTEEEKKEEEEEEGKEEEKKEEKKEEEEEEEEEGGKWGFVKRECDT